MIILNAIWSIVGFWTSKKYKQLFIVFYSFFSKKTELCEIASSFNSHQHMEAVMLPFFLYRLECELNAQEFRNRLLSYTDLPGDGDAKSYITLDGKDWDNHFKTIQGLGISQLLRDRVTVSSRRCFIAVTTVWTSKQRRIVIKTKPCAYWVC